MKTRIICEIGVNHGGSEEEAYKLIDAAVDAGADVAKFQLFQPHLFPPEKEIILKPLALPADAYIRLNVYCDKKKIKFAVTAFDADSLSWLLKRTRMDFIKIASPSIHDHKLLEVAAKSKKTIIISTGMCEHKDMVAAEKILRGCDIIFLHCVSQYPCPLEKVRLRKMLDLKRMMQRSIGLSDHSANPYVSIAAVAMGAEVVEVHFTLDRNADGPDHKASLEPAQFKMMVDGIRIVERAI